MFEIEIVLNNYTQNYENIVDKYKCFLYFCQCIWTYIYTVIFNTNSYNRIYI